MLKYRSFLAMLSLLLTAGAVLGCGRGSTGSEPGGGPIESASGPPPATGSAPLVVQGEVVAVSKVPEPGQAPYKECLTFTKYRVVSVERGEYGKPELLAVHWGMKENRLTPAARYRTGDRHRLELEPFSKRPELARVMQADDTGAFDLTPYYVIRAE
jgi:hypothetical protein